jgi:hypothetical protein
MVPEGFVSWESPIRPADGECIAVVRVDSEVVRGVAHELARLYGDSILAWRRESGYPSEAQDSTWRRFPEDRPAPEARVLATFIDSIGWRALGRRGMQARRFEPNVVGTCTYRPAGMFGVFVQRTPIAGRQSIDDVHRWAVIAWKPIDTA